MRKILTSPWTALVTLALVLGIRISDPVFVESVRLRYFDTLIANKNNVNDPKKNIKYSIIFNN